jgi:hypothetical protein
MFTMQYRPSKGGTMGRAATPPPQRSGRAFKQALIQRSGGGLVAADSDIRERGVGGMRRARRAARPPSMSPIARESTSPTSPLIIATEVIVYTRRELVADIAGPGQPNQGGRTLGSRSGMPRTCIEGGGFRSRPATARRRRRGEAASAVDAEQRMDAKWRTSSTPTSPEKRRGLRCCTPLSVARGLRTVC